MLQNFRSTLIKRKFCQSEILEDHVYSYSYNGWSEEGSTLLRKGIPHIGEVLECERECY